MTKVRLLKKYYKRYIYTALKYRRRRECKFSSNRYSCDMCRQNKIMKKKMGKVYKLINRVVGQGYWHIEDIVYIIIKLELKRKDTLWHTKR